MDANWNTGANWGGTAPVNADNLIFSGTTQQLNTNNISNLSLGWMRFANGGFTLTGNALTLNPTTTGIFTNLAGTTVIANDLFITPASKYWSIAPGSELRLTGVITNPTTAGASIGWLLVTNGGTVRIMNSAKSQRGLDIWQGTVIVDGSSALIDAGSDGFRFRPPANTTALLVLTNNGTVRIGGGGNFRMGNSQTSGGGAPAAAGSTNQVDMSSGMLELYGAAVSIFVPDNIAGLTAVFNQNGGLVWGSAGSGNAVVFGNAATPTGIYNLNGGTLWIAQVRQLNAGANVFNFNGGTLKPTINSATFFQGVDTANIKSGGAIIDTTNLNITIGQTLTGVGGLKKLGTGMLVLTGANSYAGSTVVSNGTLVVGPGTPTGGGSLVVANGATLSVTNMGGSLTVSSLTMGSTGPSTLQFNFPSGNPGSASITAGSLAGNGSVVINVTGSGLTAGTFSLMDFTSVSGLANFTLGSVPPGISASLIKTGTSIQLQITSVVKNLTWTGAANGLGLWDTSTFNWTDGINNTNYAQSGGFGDVVTFDDTASGPTAVNLQTTLTPVSITLNNNGLIYSFTGAGKISGVASLIKNGFQPMTLGTVNDYSGGTTLNAGTIYIGANQALGSGVATLNLGTLASDSTTGRTLSNSIVQSVNTGVILGDTVNTGTLTLGGGFDLAGGTGRILNFNSDVIISGSLTNGGMTTKTGPGSMVIKGTAALSILASQQQGDVIVDGGQLSNTDGWRLQNTFPGSTIRLVVTNGGVLNIANSGNTGNLRVGLTGGDNSSDNIVDISGTLNLAPTVANVNGNNAVGLGQSGVNDILYLRSGGLLIARSIFGSSPANAEAHFMGGTLRAIANDVGLIVGLTNAFMENGGLTIDTTNFTVTVPQALLASGSGGLTKTGAGTLTLTGTNTYTGATVVNGGKLVLGPAHASLGAITVNANSTLAFLQSSPPAKVNVPSVTIGSGANSALEAQLSVTNSPAGMITNLTLNGSVAVNVSGSFGIGQFPLFGYGTISGSGGLTVGILPLGTTGHLVTNTPNKTIDLVVSSVAQTIWTGAINGNWDTATTNWTLLSTPVAYAQNANVLFSDAASTPNVSLTTTLTPSTMLVSNNALNYVFSGGGSLSGNMSLVKDGTNTATLSSASTYTGNTIIKAGKLIAGNATAFGGVTAAVTVQSGASLDVNDINLGSKPVVVGGSGVNGTGALINSGGVGQNNALLDVTMSTNTTIRADSQFGIRTPNETDSGFHGNGYKLTKTGNGTLALNGGQANTSGLTVWDSDLGDVDVQQGTLSFQRRMTMGRTNNTITVQAGANLELFTMNTTVMPVQTKPVLLNNGTFGGTGNTAPEGNTFGGSITLASGTNFIRALANTTFVLLGPIIGAGSFYENSSVTGTVSLAATNTYTGRTVIQTGILTLQSSGSISNSSGVYVGSGAFFDVTAFSPWTLGAAQSLGGAGTINGNVQANGTLNLGDGAIGTLTVNGNLTLAGNVIVEVNKSLAQSNDLAAVSGTLSKTGAGSVSVTNLGVSLVVGDKFTLFSQPVPGAGSMTIAGGNATWANNLAVDGSISVLTVLPSGPTNPEPITVSQTGGNLNLAWPTIGWRLQVQTNSLATGLATNWSTVPNSTTTNAVSIPINAGNPSVFFRLISP